MATDTLILRKNIKVISEVIRVMKLKFYRYLRASLTVNQGSLVRAPFRPHTFVEIYGEIIYTVNLPLPLIQEGQMSVSGEIMYTKQVSY